MYNNIQQRKPMFRKGVVVNKNNGKNYYKSFDLRGKEYTDFDTSTLYYIKNFLSNQDFITKNEAKIWLSCSISGLDRMIRKKIVVMTPLFPGSAKRVIDVKATKKNLNIYNTL